MSTPGQDGNGRRASYQMRDRDFASDALNRSRRPFTRVQSDGQPSAAGFDPYNMPAPALVRDSSASSITSLRRRRREDAQQSSESRYNMMGRACHSDTNLGSSLDTHADTDGFNDTGSLDGRRVRARYTNLPHENRDVQNPGSSRSSAGSTFYNASAFLQNRSTGESPSAGKLPERRSSSYNIPARIREPWDVTDGGLGGDGSSDSTELPPPRPRPSGQAVTGNIEIVDLTSDDPPTEHNNDIPVSASSSRGQVRPLNTYNLDGSAFSRSEMESRGTSISVDNLPEPPQSRGTLPEVVLPRWQPDAEVTLCPICRTQFSFFVRKHHCRKCGRVVCNSCSPHRITIPYQFIVQPPEYPTATSPIRPSLDQARAGSDSNFTSLGGGARVRLCNPCVPDPNIAPPQTPDISNSRRPSGANIHSHIRSTSLAISSSGHQQGSSRPLMNINNYPQRTRESSALSQAYRVAGSSSLQPTSHIGFHNASMHSPGNTSNRSRSSTTAGDQPSGSERTHHNFQRSRTSRDDHSSRPLPRPPRLAEEDECPVCHLELPSSALPDSEALREAHINNCIESAFKQTTTSAPPARASINTTAGPSRHRAPSSSAMARGAMASTPEGRAAAREQAHASVVLGHSSSPPLPIRRTGVFPYTATEKDCIDDAECTICLEEFETGEEMGRLECFCRFHLRCIRQWFERHPGQCPVHQHDGAF